MPQQQSSIVQRVSDYLFPAKKVLRKASGEGDIKPDVQATDQADVSEVGVKSRGSGPAEMLRQNEEQEAKRRKALKDAISKSKSKY